MRRVPVDTTKRERFEALFVPHLDSAYNLARWLTRNEHDAQDVVQEAYLRAFQAFDSFQTGRDGRPWLLRIVRNTCYTWLHQNRPAEVSAAIDEMAEEATSIELALIEKATAEMVRAAIAGIAVEFREVLVLRELDGLSYKEIAQIAGVPLGTVMSRLARGRRELQSRLSRNKG